jgi:hypothetical protein
MGLLPEYGRAQLKALGDKVWDDKEAFIKVSLHASEAGVVDLVADEVYVNPDDYLVTGWGSGSFAFSMGEADPRALALMFNCPVTVYPDGRTMVHGPYAYDYDREWRAKGVSRP